MAEVNGMGGKSLEVWLLNSSRIKFALVHFGRDGSRTVVFENAIPENIIIKFRELEREHPNQEFHMLEADFERAAKRPI